MIRQRMAIVWSAKEGPDHVRHRTLSVPTGHVLRQCDVSGTTRILRDQLGRSVGIVGVSGHAEAASQSAHGCASIGVDGKAAANGHRSLTRICD
jgi:hypothetical protein